MPSPGLNASKVRSWKRALVRHACGCLLLIASLALWGDQPTQAEAEVPSSIAFYSEAGLPLDELGWFDEVVLDPAKVTDAELTVLRSKGVRAVAAVSDGQGAMLDGLSKRGFGGFLFDGRSEVNAAAVDSLVLEARRRFGQAVIYFRGPSDRLPALARALSAYVAEGIFTEPEVPGVVTPAALRDDLETLPRMGALVEVRRRYKFPFIVLERAPLGYREQARGIARTLVDRGFIPHVTVGGGGLGITQREVIPRRILALYDSEEEPELVSTVIHRSVAVPLEYFGYVIDYLDVRSKLPAGDLASRYAGIVSWFSDDDMPQPRTYEQWLQTQISSGVRLAIIGHLGFQPTSTLLGRLGLSISNRRLVGPMTINNTGKMIGFEARPAPIMRGLQNLRPLGGVKGVEVHLELRDGQAQVVTPVVTAPWGGLALDPYVVDRGLDRQRWIVDPFAFFTRALDLEPMPVPDFTTENGKRLLFIHIDGDSFNSVAQLPGRPFTGQIILREFLEKYPFPTTVSIVEGQMSSQGTNPNLTDKLEPIARDIFALPNVEVASHSFAHPFDWLRAARGETGLSKLTGDEVMLPIPGYKYSAAREVGGSIHYINERLAPKDKPCKVFLWSGAAVPGADALKEVYAGNYYNMNGGNGELPLDDPALATVPSLGRYLDGMLQVYAQAQNENVYTNEWRGPFYGFRRVIDFFKYTESPYRLKPINIYYHFYSGEKLAGVTALREIYDYAQEQDTYPIVVSEMVQKIQDFQRVAIARRLDGGWELRNFGKLRTVRLDKRLGWPNIVDSVNVAGVEDGPVGRYVALSGEPTATLAIQGNRPSVPHLVSANAAIVSWQRDRETLKFQLRGHMPVEMTVGGCTPSGGVSRARVRVDQNKKTARLTFSGHDTGEVTLSCR
jgi:hypothetical protein